LSGIILAIAVRLLSAKICDEAQGFSKVCRLLPKLSMRPGFHRLPCRMRVRDVVHPAAQCGTFRCRVFQLFRHALFDESEQQGAFLLAVPAQFIGKHRLQTVAIQKDVAAKVAAYAFQCFFHAQTSLHHACFPFLCEKAGR